MAGEIVTKSKRFYCVSIFPDICLTPIGPTMVPVPYTIVGEFSEATGVSPNIRSNGEPVVIHSSTVIPRVYGDEPGIGKGIKSKTVGARVQHMEKSSTLSFNGERAIRVGDLVYMNDKNTIGKVYERLPCPTAAELAEAGKPSGVIEALAKLINDPSAATKVLEFIPSVLLNLVPGGPLLPTAWNAATGAINPFLAKFIAPIGRDSPDGRSDVVRKPAAAARKASSPEDGGRSRGHSRDVPTPDNSSILRANDRATMPWLYEESQPTSIDMIMSAEGLKFGSYYSRVSGLSFGIPVDNDGFMFSNTYPVTPGVGVAFTDVVGWDGKSQMVMKYGMFTGERNAEGGYYFREATEDEASVMLGTHSAGAAAAGKNALINGTVGYGLGIGSVRGISALPTRTPLVRSPTKTAVRGLKDFGLTNVQRRSFFEGKSVIFEDPSTAFETATIFKLSPNTFHAGVYDIVSDGNGALLNFANRSRALGNSLGVKNLELFGADIQNPQLKSLLLRRGFEPGAPVKIDAFGFDKYVETLRKTEELKK